MVGQMGMQKKLREFSVKTLECMTSRHLVWDWQILLIGSRLFKFLTSTTQQILLPKLEKFCCTAKKNGSIFFFHYFFINLHYNFFFFPKPSISNSGFSNPNPSASNLKYRARGFKPTVREPCLSNTGLSIPEFR